MYISETSSKFYFLVFSPSAVFSLSVFLPLFVLSFLIIHHLFSGLLCKVWALLVLYTIKIFFSKKKKIIHLLWSNLFSRSFEDTCWSMEADSKIIFLGVLLHISYAVISLTVKLRIWGSNFVIWVHFNFIGWFSFFAYEKFLVICIGHSVVGFL